MSEQSGYHEAAVAEPGTKIEGADSMQYGAETEVDDLKKVKNPRKPRIKSKTKVKALEELKNALTLASLASQQMETEKEQMTVKEITDLMQTANVAKLNETMLPDYKGFGFYHKSGKKIRYFTLTTRSHPGIEPAKLAKKRKLKLPKQGVAEDAGVGGGDVVAGPAPLDQPAAVEPTLQQPAVGYVNKQHPHASTDPYEQQYHHGELTQEQVYHQQMLYHQQAAYGHQAHTYGAPAAHPAQFVEQAYHQAEVVDQSYRHTDYT